MNDDRMDQLLARGTRDYNEPGEVPREAMWARIQAARVAAPRGPATQPRRALRVWVWPSAAVAAGVLLYAGIAIGRRLEHAAGPTAQKNVATVPAAAAGSDASGSRKDSVASVAPRSPMPDVPKQAAKDEDVIRRLRDQTNSTNRRARELAQGSPPTGDNQSNDLAYHLVVLQHLAGSEAMITAFRSSARRGEVDREIVAWSRELLSTTRMLESSTLGQDPMMRRLLEDLDLVIAQIAQYVSRGTNNSDDLDLIEQSINKRGVISKLRSTLPARTLPAGT